MVALGLLISTRAGWGATSQHGPGEKKKHFRNPLMIRMEQPQLKNIFDKKTHPLSNTFCYWRRSCFSCLWSLGARWRRGTPAVGQEVSQKSEELDRSPVYLCPPHRRVPPSAPPSPAPLSGRAARCRHPEAPAASARFAPPKPGPSAPLAGGSGKARIAPSIPGGAAGGSPAGERKETERPVPPRPPSAPRVAPRPPPAGRSERRGDPAPGGTLPPGGPARRGRRGPPRDRGTGTDSGTDTAPARQPAGAHPHRDRSGAPAPLGSRRQRLHPAPSASTGTAGAGGRSPEGCG